MINRTDRDGLDSRAWRAASRHAFSLLELIAVVAILGIFAAVAVTRFGHDAIANAGAHGFARKLSLDLLHAQRRSISVGDNHYLNVHTSGSSVTGYTLMRRDAGGDVAVDDLRDVPNNVQVAASHNECEYDFEGAALAAYSFTVTGPDRSWSVVVIPVTGAVRVTEF